MKTNEIEIGTGDTVECVEDFDTIALKKGNLYEVESCNESFLNLKDIGLNDVSGRQRSLHGGWNRNRFVKVVGREVLKKSTQKPERMRNIELEDD